MAQSANGLGRIAIVGLLVVTLSAAWGQDERTLPSSLTKEQRGNLLQFLKGHESPTRYVPKGAKVGDAPPPDADAAVTATKERPIRQYTAQITMHRPVPGQEQVTRADVYYYRPNPEKGKPGLTVKYTVDLTTGQPVGEAVVLTKAHTPVSREELAEALAAAKEKAASVKALYKGRQPGDVRWEYLQMKINRKSAQFEPGDRVVRFVFTVNPDETGKEPAPVRVLVNLTRDLVVPDDR
ncbi:MAG: hypothetical protein U0797_01385 [Gemmataceae bacterium]